MDTQCDVSRGFKYRVLTFRIAMIIILIIDTKNVCIDSRFGGEADPRVGNRGDVEQLEKYKRVLPYPKPKS